MKKVILALAVSATLSFASDSTLGATMNLMKQGMNQIQQGFMYNSRIDIQQGIEIVTNSNDIFKHVDVANFIKSNKVTVAKNINHNLSEDLKALKKAVDNAKYTEATVQYSKVMSQCIACHTIIRGW